jgi:hypothetical protein
MGIAPHYTSPPRRVDDFIEFAVWSVRKYAANMNTAAKKSSAVMIGAE